MRDLCVEMSIY